MKRYMYEGTWTQELEDEVENSISKPLVEEMFYKYGLTVYAKSREFKNSFLMTMDGLPYCEVYIDKGLNIKTAEEESVYNYYSHYYTKDRGSDMDDKRTLRSTKMSKLIATIDKKEALMPDHTSLLSSSLINNATNEVRNKVKNPSERKYIGNVQIETVEKLLKHAVNKASISGEEMKEYKVILDKWNKIDDDERRAEETVNTMFGNEMYVIAETGDKGYAIASIKVTNYKQYHYDYEIIKPFQRVLSLDDYEYIDEIRPVLTMYKLHKEMLNKEKRSFDYELSYAQQSYFEDLGIIVSYDSFPSNTSYRPVWTFIPTVTA